MQNKTPAADTLLNIESVSSVFAHDIATPLTTAQLNVDLLVEHIALLEKMVATEMAETIPHHIRHAIKSSPRIIQGNLRTIQRALQDYKNYLNAYAVTENACESLDHRDNFFHRDARQISEPLAEQPPTRVTKLRILLVDDEQIHHDIATAVIGKYHDLAHEFSGLAALERCHSDTFDVILMDMQMPKLSGPHTVEKLRCQIPSFTRILGLTSMPIEKSKSDLLELGFDGFLEKPLKYDKFNQLIDSLISPTRS